MKHEWLKEILGESYTDEADKKVAEKLGELFVSKADYNAANEKKMELEERANDLVDNGELQKKYDELKSKYKAETESLKKKVDDVVKNSAVDMAIYKAKGKNAKAIKALIDMEKVTVKEDGTIMGLDLESIKKTDGYLFDMETKQSVGTGFTKGTSSKGTDVNDQIARAMGIKSK
ncbi:MAG: phage scaffolding protein [Lachnospiraceae bacterium]|nr:phage scaffolding protein [Lachnospiraceae bacterium]